MCPRPQTTSPRAIDTPTFPHTHAAPAAVHTRSDQAAVSHAWVARVPRSLSRHG